MMGMNSRYLDIKREVRNQLLRDCLVRAATSPLALLWLFGFVLFLIWVPPLALLWSVVALLAGFGLCANVARDKDAQANALRAVVQRLFVSGELDNSRRGQQLKAAVDLFVEVVSSVTQARWALGAELYVARTLSNLCELMDVYRDAAANRIPPSSFEVDVKERVIHVLTNIRRLVSVRVSLVGPTSVTVAIDLARHTFNSLSAILSRLDSTQEPRLASSAGDLFQAESADLTADAAPYELQELATSLRFQFGRREFDPGLKALDQLERQYSRLVPVLERKKETDPTAVARIPQLAEEAYRQGLSVLRDVYELAQDVGSGERERLENEATALEDEMTALKASGGNEQRIQIREETLAFHRERLGIMYEHDLRIEELLHQCERCEASLDRVRMELSVLRGESSSGSVTVVIDSLRQTVDQARSVQNELKRIGLEEPGPIAGRKE